jgi:hypothetical protein
VEPSFNIRSGDTPSLQKHLLAEIGPQGLSLVCTGETGAVTDCVVYHFAAGTSSEILARQLTGIFAAEPLLASPYKKTDLVYAFDQAILTPHEVYNMVNNDQMLDEVFGDAQEMVGKTDFVYKQNLHTVYRVPAAVNFAVNAAFPLASCTHQYSLLADAFGREKEGFHAIFYTHSLVVVLHSGGKLQVIRHFGFDTPETAAWHLLNVCSCCNISPAEVALTLHGMIDSKSALYAELYKYFMQLNFAALPPGLKYSLETAAQPHHFFSHLFAMMLCV